MFCAHGNQKNDHPPGERFSGGPFEVLFLVFTRYGLQNPLQKIFLSGHEALTVFACCMHAGWRLREATSLPHPDRTSENEHLLFVSPLDPLVPFVGRALCGVVNSGLAIFGSWRALLLHWISADKIATQYPSGAT